jgi:putative endonuclease
VAEGSRAFFPARETAAKDLGLMKVFITYILTNASRSTLYTGMTGRITHRMFQHRHHVFHSFTARYNVARLVYYERFASPDAAIAREKQIKGWTRAKKIALIESVNPAWDDLSREWENVFKPESKT